MNIHAADEQIIGYLYRTLSDAEREVLDTHFPTCPSCRARLSKHEVQQRQIDHDLKASINGVAPSERMTFAAISPQLPGRRSFNLLRLKLEMTTPVLVTLLGILFSLIGLGQGVSSLLSKNVLHSPGAFPTVAGFFFIFVSVEQLERALAVRPRFVFEVTLASLLWLGTAIIGLINLLVIRDLSIWVFTELGGTNMQTGAATILVITASALIYIAGVIGGAEYHYKRIGQPNSWKLFAWTMGIEVLILVLPHFVF